MAEFIRVWKEFDLGDISEHLLIVGDVTGDCSKCRALGIDYSDAKECPECGTHFKYIATRTGHTPKIKQRRPDLIFIDFDDYRKATGKLKARKLFA